MSDQDEADVHDSQDNDSAESRPSNSTFWFNMDKPDLDEADFQMCIFWLATGAPLFGGYATTFLILHVEAIRAYGPGWLYLYGIIASSIPVLIGWILLDKCSNILIRRFGVMLGNGAFNCMCLLFFVGPCFLLAMIVGIFLGGGDGQLFTITVVVMCLVGVFWLIVQPRGLLAYVSSVASYLGTCLLLLLAIFLGNRTSVSDAYHQAYRDGELGPTLTMEGLVRATRWYDGNYNAHASLSWRLAAHPREEIRDSARAIQHGTRACELTG